MTDIEKVPFIRDWIAEAKLLPPPKGKDIVRGPYELLSQNQQYKLRYQAYADSESMRIVEETGLHSILQHQGNPRDIITPIIFKITHTSLPNGVVTQCISIEKVEFPNEERDMALRLVHYSSDGMRFLLNIYSQNEGYRQSALNARHFIREQLPPMIDFQATVDAFLHQTNSPSTRFQIPMLVSAV